MMKQKMRTELPEKWYVLYRDEDEFKIIKKKFDKDWTYFEGQDQYGYTNEGTTGSWVDLKGSFYNLKTIKEKGLEEITWNEFEVLVLGYAPPEPEIPEDMSYLENFFKERSLI